ncbi:MAG: hypothetical protein COT09_05115 [Candidatus Hydromicrobium americanum]|nr:MAG: hypothetical protein COT09_05115 [Candidatus Hydromicrobium americanum]
MKRISFTAKIIILVFLAALILPLLAGCRKNFYISGASYGYYIWEEDSSIFVEWSADRKDSKFDGGISTDGKITEYKLKEWEEENDVIKVGEDKINFSATLDRQDYSDGFSFNVQDHTYLEFDLKMNDGYDLSRINVGGFLENPENNIFRIEKDYFSQLKMKHWYQRRPFSEFFSKLFSNKYFTFTYLFILGIIIIEILRVTVLTRRRRKIIWLAISYTTLILVEICIYFILKFLVR